MNRKTYFNEAAKTWDERYNTPELTHFLHKLVPSFRIKSGQRILDLGTGTGILIPYLLQAIGPSGEITAIDYAEEMVNICKSKFSEHENVKIENQNVEKLTYSSNYFDAVTCFGSFPHLESKEIALSQIYRVLKKGGKLFIAHAMSSYEIKARHKEASTAVVKDMLPDKDSMIKLLNGAGFIDIQIKDEPGYYLCKSKKT